jgi:hypothetical protein
MRVVDALDPNLLPAVPTNCSHGVASLGKMIRGEIAGKFIRA